MLDHPGGELDRFENTMCVYYVVLLLFVFRNFDTNPHTTSEFLITYVFIYVFCVFVSYYIMVGKYPMFPSEDTSQRIH